MKNEKKLHGFSYSKSMANFEAFCKSFLLSTNLIILKSVMLPRTEKLKSTEYIITKDSSFYFKKYKVKLFSLRNEFPKCSRQFCTFLNIFLVHWMIILTASHVIMSYICKGVGRYYQNFLQMVQTSGLFRCAS